MSAPATPADMPDWQSAALLYYECDQRRTPANCPLTPCCTCPHARAVPATPAATPAAPRGTNPKDAIGATKVSLSKLPAVAVLHGSHAMMNGAAKYGAFNWRGNPVIASIYVDACLRHVSAWFDREELAQDSGVHHLGHALACVAILLDAQATGNLVDDRPAGGAFCRELERLNAAVKARAAAPAAPRPAVPVSEPLDDDAEPAPAAQGCAKHPRDHACTTCKNKRLAGYEQPCRDCRHAKGGDSTPCLWESP